MVSYTFAIVAASLALISTAAYTDATPTLIQQQILSANKVPLVQQQNASSHDATIVQSRSAPGHNAISGLQQSLSTFNPSACIELKTHAPSSMQFNFKGKYMWLTPDDNWVPSAGSKCTHQAKIPEASDLKSATVECCPDLFGCIGSPFGGPKVWGSFKVGGYRCTVFYK
jgi:hypothetical protein